MNSVFIVGRLGVDPRVTFGSGEKKSVARFTVALNRGKDKQGNDLGADFPSIVCFGKTAELAEQYLGKGSLVAVQGRIQTGSYEKDGKKVYTTEILADRLEFLDRRSQEKVTQDKQDRADAERVNNAADPLPSGFAEIDDTDIPF